jgi:trehalose 6-phosphate phosphatase
MRILNESIDPDRFFSGLREASARLLMLDYDGTLAPFTPNRDKAVPYDELLPVLGMLFADERCRTVIISGRAVRDLQALLPFDILPEIWGSHGWERLRRDGRHETPELDAGTLHVLEHEWQWLRSLFPESQIERKPASVALHWRGFTQDVQVSLRALCRKRWHRLHESTGIELHAFSGGAELRATGRSKADAVHALLAEHDSTPVAAFLGDDLTDEDAFAALEGRGLRVLVRPELRETRADLHLLPPHELLTFLEQWIRHLQ